MSTAGACGVCVCGLRALVSAKILVGFRGALLVLWAPPGGAQSAFESAACALAGAFDLLARDGSRLRARIGARGTSAHHTQLYDGRAR